MLKITAIGNLTHDVELKMNENTGKPYGGQKNRVATQSFDCSNNSGI